ncbi:MAG: cell division protein FtsH, partial [Novosphingobium sp. 35-62-5]
MNDDQPQGNPWIKSLLVWGGIFLALLLVVSMFGSRVDQASTTIPYSAFRSQVADGSVRAVEIAPDRITGTLKNGGQFTTVPVPGDSDLPRLLQENSVQYAGKAAEQPNMLMYILVNSLPFLLILGVAFFALRQVQKG